MAVKITVDKVNAVFRSVRTLTTNDVLVGVPSTTADRKPDEPSQEPANNALIGYAMEFGVPDKNIPARPFLIPGVRNAQEKIIAQMKAGTLRALTDATDVAGKSLMAVGLTAQNAVRQKITAGPFQPLAERTLEARRRRGVTRTKPLIDTGQLRASITYVVRPKD